MKRTASVLVLLLAAVTWVACGASSPPDPYAVEECTGGESRTCTCANGAAGSQSCNASHVFDTCTCGLSGPLGDGGHVCGDSRCDNGETCTTCPGDCGACKKCPAAPSCTDAVGVPSNPTPRPDLFQTTVDAGALEAGAPLMSSECLAPQLRMRIESIKANKGGGELYCIVNASDGATSEVAITQKTKSLNDGETNFFDPSVALYWGQKDLRPTTNNLTITYNCFVVKTDAYSKVVKAAGDSAIMAGGVAGPYGWAFGLGGVAANVAAAALAAAAGDELRLNAQQVIDKSELLDLTNGRTWMIRKGGGCGLLCNWDWEVHVQSWGCADAKVGAN